jgi:hypothetical protein
VASARTARAAAAVACALTFGAAVVALPAGAADGAAGGPPTAASLAPEGLERRIREAERLAALVDRSPQQLSRERALRGIDRAGALSALRESFPGFAAAAPERQVAAEARGEVVAYLGEQVARLRPSVPGGRGRLLVSTRPLVARDGTGRLAPVDFSLLDAGLDRRPRNAPFHARLGERSASGFQLGPTPDRAIAVTPLDAAAVERPSATAGGLLWPNTHPDSDSIAKVVTGGIETFEQIRSADAPEVFRYRLQLRPGQTAVSSGGTVEVREPSGEAVVRVLAPMAADRNGRPVAARLELAGDVLSVVAEHRAADYAYPVLLDPPWHSVYDWEHDPGVGNAGWGIEQTGGGMDWYDAWAGTGPGWSGLFVRPKGGRVYPANTEVKLSWQAPGTTLIDSVRWLGVTPTNNSERQTTRLAVFGAQWYAADFFATTPIGTVPVVEVPDPADQPARAQRAELWMFTPPCVAGERNCPRMVARDGLTMAKVAAVDIALTDEDLPTGTLTGPLLADVDRWSTGAGPWTLDVGGADAGSGIAWYALRVTDASGTSPDLEPQTVVCDPRHQQPSMGSAICPGAQSRPFTLRSAPDGKVTLTVHARDLAGNAGQRSWDLYLDRTAPSVDADGPLVDLAGAWTRGASPANVRMLGDDQGAGVSELRLVARSAAGEEVFDHVVATCTPQGPLSQPCPARPRPSFTVPVDRLPGGATVFEATARDHVGHGAAPKRWTVRIDRSRPVVRASGPLVDAPRPARATNDTAPIPVTVTAKDASSGAGIATVELFAENAAGRRAIASADVCAGRAACPSSTEQRFEVDPLDLPEGVTTFHAVATDRVGNRSEPTDDFDSFQDHTAPSTPTGVKLTAVGETTLEVTWDRSIDNVAGSGVSHYQYQLVVNGEPSEWVNVHAPRVTLPGLPSDTSVEVIVRALDYAANPSKYARRGGRTGGRRGGRSGGGGGSGDDGDGSGGPVAGTAAASRALQLVRRFHPWIYFDREEKWFPVNVESLLARGQIDARWNGVANFRYPRTPRQLMAFSDPSYAAFMSIRPTDGRADPTSIYAHADRFSATREFQYLDYWWFYRFNEAGVVGNAFDHLGDWEGLFVAVNRRHPNKIGYVGMSAHKGTFHYLREATHCGSHVKPCTSGQHVHAYAANGTHATYPHYCTGCKQTVFRVLGIPLKENSFDGQVPWANNYDNPEAVKGFPGGIQFFKGSWSGRTKEGSRVDSPGQQERYRSPQTVLTCTRRWAGGANTEVPCDYSRLDVNPRASSSGARSGRGGAERAVRSARLTVAEEWERRTAGADPSCASWFGVGVAAVACDPLALQLALDTGALGSEEGPLSASGSGFTAGSAPGLVQVAGAPLRAGQAIRFDGSFTSRTALYVRGVHGGATTVNEYRDLAMAPGQSLTVEAVVTGGRMELQARRSDGSLVRPSHSDIQPAPGAGARPAAPRGLRATVRGRDRVTIGFRSATRKDLVMLLDRDGRVVRQRIVRGAPGRRTVRLRSWPAVRSVRVRSIDAAGRLSAPARARVVRRG